MSMTIVMACGMKVSTKLILMQMHLSDYAEFHIYGTDYNLQDTDGDMLDDGEEILEYQSNPLVYDNDTDLDGFYWFQDCNDTNAAIYPGAIEMLNSIDDNCDGLWDEGFNQAPFFVWGWAVGVAGKSENQIWLLTIYASLLMVQTTRQTSVSVDLV